MTLAEAIDQADLRSFARGKQCLVRLPVVCNGDSSTTVLAHIRRAAAGGTGLKPPDLCATIACSACHDAIDGRVDYPKAMRYFVTPEEMDGYVLDAVLRFLVLISKEK